MTPKNIDEIGQPRIGAARDRQERAEAASEKAWAAWLVEKDDAATAAFLAALDEQAAAARDLADIVMKKHGAGSRSGWDRVDTNGTARKGDES